MYIIRNDIRNAYKTHDGWTTIQDGHLIGLHDVLRFTDSEAARNTNALPKGSRFVYFPRRRWKDMQ
jgi:hypothetical protein